MDKFICPHRQNMRQPGFWKIANGGSDDEANLEDQIESQATETLDNIEEAYIDYTASQTSSLAPSDSVSSPFLEPPKPKRQRQETSWVYTHFQQTTIGGKTFFDKQTGKTKTDIQYTCLHCTALEKWVTVKSVTKGSTGNLQKHLGQKHGIYRDQNTPLGITIGIRVF